MSLRNPFDCIRQCNSFSIGITMEITLSLRMNHTSAFFSLSMYILSHSLNDNVDKINNKHATKSRFC